MCIRDRLNLVKAIELVESIENISQSNVIESIEKIMVIFDWLSIAFGNRISIIRLRSIDSAFDSFDGHRQAIPIKDIPIGMTVSFHQQCLLYF